MSVCAVFAVVSFHTLLGVIQPEYILFTFSILSLALFGIICYSYGLISVEALLAVLIVYPGVVPFLSIFVFHTEVYVLRGQTFQSTGIGARAAILTLICLSVYYLTIRVRYWSTNVEFRYNCNPINQIALNSNWVSIGLLSIAFLAMAYLTAPGPTILTVSYSTVIENYYSWANFAGSAFVGFWIVIFLTLRSNSLSSDQYRVLVLLTAVGIGWLLLHARRNESLGVLAVLVLDVTYRYGGLRGMMETGRGILSGLAVGTLGFLMIFVELVRSGRTLEEIFVQSGGGVTAPRLPGGAHNIYGTFQATVSIFSTERSYLLGETFFWYPVQTIPTGFYSLLGLSPPQFYFEILRSSYASYLGGNFFLNVYYANFGVIGIVLAGVILASIARFCRANLRGQEGSRLYVGLGAVFVAGAPRALWYTQIAWADILQGFVAALVSYVVIMRVTGVKPFYYAEEGTNGR